MTWTLDVVYDWTCDGCSLRESLADDLQPDGWIHTQDGRDLCKRCQQ